MRGKRQNVVVDLGHDGLIPARAGKTVACSRVSSSGTAHPRACGENVMAQRTLRYPGGSSPRVRGKRHALRQCPADQRLIPARAGKTHFVAPRSRADTAHPRACGENAGHGPAPGSASGASPRVRGKRGWVRARLPLGRLIPARAGKTHRGPTAIASRGAHPRACGENVFDVAEALHGVGSSPRVRGKRRERRYHEPGRGLIPARAGKTSVR